MLQILSTPVLFFMPTLALCQIHPDGFLLSYDHSNIFRSSHKPFWLGKSESMALVNHSINFRDTF